MLSRLSAYVPWIVVLMLILAPSHLFAQVASPNTKSSSDFITFSIESQLNPDGKTFSDIPTGILDQLVQYQSLNEVDLVKNGEKWYQLTAEFLFYNLEEFKQWYHSDKVRELLTNLENENPSFYRIDIDIHVTREGRGG